MFPAFRPSSWKAPHTSIWPWVALLQYAFIAVTATTLALELDPQPHSDWLYYWHAASDAGYYQRGGVGLGLLAVLKLIGLSPVAASLSLNLPSAAALLVLAYRADHSAWRLPAQIIVIYLWLVTPFYGIVQLDLVATSMLAASLWLVLGARRRPSPARVFAAVVLGGAAVSTKPQLSLVLWAMTSMLLAAGLLVRWHWPRRAGMLVIVMLVTSFGGFGADYAFRAVVGQKDSMRTSSAVTLYGGLLVSGTGPGCGYWSPAAADAAKSDMDKSLYTAITERLVAKPPLHWFEVISCKAPQILLPPPYALYWLFESPNVRATLLRGTNAEAVERAHTRMRKVESVLYRGCGVLILACVLVLSWRAWSFSAPIWALIAPSWVLAFWAVHAIFEIQGRYFLPMSIIAPLLATLAARGGDRKSDQSQKAV